MGGSRNVLASRQAIRNIILPGAATSISEIAMTMKFPFVENTLGKKQEAGTGISVDCLHASGRRR